MQESLEFRNKDYLPSHGLEAVGRGGPGEDKSV